MFRSVCKWVVFKWLYPVCYFFGRLRKIKPEKILFVENHADSLSDNFLLLKEFFEKKGYDIRIHYLRISSSGWGKIIKRSLGMIWDMSNAGCVFLNESNSLFGSGMACLRSL